MKMYEVSKSETSNDFNVHVEGNSNAIVFSGKITECLAYIELKNMRLLRF